MTHDSYDRYRKYCKPGQHYVSHLVKRYYIMAKMDKNHIPVRVPKQSTMCKQCAEYAGDWSGTLKKARIEILTRILAG